MLNKHLSNKIETIVPVIGELPSKADFEAYERVRASGETNMFDVGMVEMLSGLSRKEIIAVMKNYAALDNKYPTVRKS